MATGILLNNTSSEVQFENVTTHATGGTSQTVGVNLSFASATLEGLRARVSSGVGTTYGVSCVGAGEFANLLDATLSVDSFAGTGSALGVSVSNCNTDLRNAVVDAVAAAGTTYAVYHLQGDDTIAANVTISDVELRSESGESGANGIYLASSGATAAGTFGRVTDANIRVTGGSESSSTRAIYHAANGGVEYRGLSLISGGSALFMYGIQTVGDGSHRFDDVVIDAIGEAEATVFGVEFQTDWTTLTNARVAAVNYDTGTVHDAVGIKSNNADGVAFTDVTAYAEAETNVWGADLVGSDTRLMRVDARAVSTNGETTVPATPDVGFAHGASCWIGTTEIHDSQFWGSASAEVSYGVIASHCDATVRGSELVAAGSSTNLGLFAQAGTGLNNSIVVRDSYLSGSTNTVLTAGAGAVDVQVVHSQLDGGAGSQGGGSSQKCTAVTYNSGGGEAFQDVTASPCP